MNLQIIALSKIVFAFALLCLTACGFQLRGAGPANLSAESVYINAPETSELANQLQSSLSQLGVTVTDDSTIAQYILKLSTEQLSRRVLTVSPTTGKVTEFEIIFDTSMSVLDSKGSVLSAPQNIRVRTDLSVDEDSALGKFDEERLVGQELRQRASNQILRRFQAVIQ